MGVYRDTELRHPGKRVAVGMAVVEQVCKGGSDVDAVVFRNMMLLLLRSVMPESLASWTKDDEFEEVVFRVAADIPMEWLGREGRKGLPFDPDEFFRRVRGE